MKAGILARMGSGMAIEVMAARRMTRERIFLVELSVLVAWHLNRGTPT